MILNKHYYKMFFFQLQLLSGSGQTTTGSAQSPVPTNPGTGGSGVVVGNANNG